MANQCKYYKQKRQVSYDNGVTWQDVSPLTYQRGDLIEYDSSECGSSGTIYRWVDITYNSGDSSTYICDNYTLYRKQKQQVSYDNGLSWADTGSYQKGAVIETYSDVCGYVPTVDYKALLTLANGTKVQIPDDGDPELKQSEISGYSGSVVSAIITNVVTNIGQSAFENCTSLTSVTIPDSVTEIVALAFSHCHKLININIPTGVTTIGYGAFSYCYNLASVVIPDSVTSIGDCLFYDCIILSSVTIPDSITSIGFATFYKCSSLTEITIPDSITSIGSQTFYSCSALASIISNATTAPTIENYTFEDIKTGGTLYYPSGSDYSSWLSNSKYHLGYYNWTGQTFGPTPSVDYKALLTLNDSSTVEIPDDGDTTLKQSEISGYSGTVVSAVITNRVTSIGFRAFFYCTGLTSVTIPDSVTSIGGAAFNSCTSLTSVTIPSGVTSIVTSVFGYCYSLTTITIPNSVTSIDIYAFYGCSSLTSVTIGTGVTSIREYAFENCSGLTSITCNATTAPTISSFTFQNINTGGTLYYPSGSDYSSWLSTSNDYLGYYNWTSQTI